MSDDNAADIRATLLRLRDRVLQRTPALTFRQQNKLMDGFETAATALIEAVIAAESEPQK